MQSMTVVRRMRGPLLASFLLLTLGAAIAAAQDAPLPFQVRLGAGAFAPGNGLKDWVGGSSVYGLEASYEFNPYLGVTGSSFFGDTKARMYNGAFGDTQLWQFDAGLEGRVPSISAGIGADLRLAPFLGAGVGRRSYDLKDSFMSGHSSGLAGYGALGLDLTPTRGRVGLRAEAREYRSSFVDMSHFIPRTTEGDFTYFLGISWR